MKRYLIPKSLMDRVGIGLAFLSFAISVWAAMSSDPLDNWLTLLGLAGTIIWLFNVYVLQEQVAPNPSTDEYSVVIERIAAMGKQLSELSRFLEKEQARVADTEATIRKLDQEKSKLEPLVQTQREVVEAILTAHSQRTAKRAWKERFLGFGLGVLASLIAAMILEYFKR